MKNNTLDDYKKAIRVKYDEIINLNPDGYLQNPSRGNLRSKSLVLLDNINADDLIVYRRFFDLKNDADARKEIEKFDIDKFRPLQSFLLGKNENPSDIKLEMLAILVELESRPFKKFMMGGITKSNIHQEAKQSEEKTEDAVNSEENKEVEKTKDAKKVSTYEHLNASHKNEHIKQDSSDRIPVTAARNFSSNKNSQVLRKERSYYKPTAIHFVLVSLIIGVFLYGYFTKYIFTEHECMAWKDDHYEAISCNTEVNSFMGATIVHIDKETLKYQKRVTACDTTTFFMPDGRPCVWYCKMPNGTIEYFSYPGLHPTTGKTLKKITRYMINKYVRR